MLLRLLLLLLRCPRALLRVGDGRRRGKKRRRRRGSDDGRCRRRVGTRHLPDPLPILSRHPLSRRHRWRGNGCRALRSSARRLLTLSGVVVERRGRSLRRLRWRRRKSIHLLLLRLRRTRAGRSGDRPLGSRRWCSRLIVACVDLRELLTGRRRKRAA